MRMTIWMRGDNAECEIDCRKTSRAARAEIYTLSDSRFFREKAGVLAYFVHRLSPFVFEFREGVGLRWYGVAYVLAFLLGYWLYHWLAERGYSQMPPSQVSDFITWAAVFGVMLGGRLGWAVFYGWHDVAENPLTFFKVWEGGMASHGGIIGLVAFTFYWSRRYKLSWTSIGDSLCVVAPIGLFLVRCANFINGELYGKPAEVPCAATRAQRRARRLRDPLRKVATGAAAMRLVRLER